LATGDDCSFADDAPYADGGVIAHYGSDTDHGVVFDDTSVKERAVPYLNMVPNFTFLIYTSMENAIFLYARLISNHYCSVVTSDSGAGTNIALHSDSYIAYDFRVLVHVGR
jgi:hypothetical protein